MSLKTLLKTVHVKYNKTQTQKDLFMFALFSLFITTNFWVYFPLLTYYYQSETSDNYRIIIFLFLFLQIISPQNTLNSFETGKKVNYHWKTDHELCFHNHFHWNGVISFCCWTCWMEKLLLQRPRKTHPVCPSLLTFGDYTSGQKAQCLMFAQWLWSVIMYGKITSEKIHYSYSVFVFVF